jgi:hypothetical protein
VISVLGTTEQFYDIDSSVFDGISSSATIATTNVSPNGMGLNAQFALPNAFIKEPTPQPFTGVVMSCM